MSTTCAVPSITKLEFAKEFQVPRDPAVFEHAWDRVESIEKELYNLSSVAESELEDSYLNLTALLSEFEQSALERDGGQTNYLSPLRLLAGFVESVSLPPDELLNPFEEGLLAFEADWLAFRERRPTYPTGEFP